MAAVGGQFTEFYGFFLYVQWVYSKSILLNILSTIMQHPVISDVHATVHVWGEYGKGIQDRYSLNTRVYEHAHAHTLCLLNPGFLVLHTSTLVKTAYWFVF